MTNYLLDTHVLLWSIFESYKLSEKSKKILLDRNSGKFVSVSSIWEISIKYQIGKLPLPHGLSDIFTEIKLNGFGYLGIGLIHIEKYNALPLLHRDPFDGIIVAMAMSEQMTIITADENIQKYDVQWVW